MLPYIYLAFGPCRWTEGRFLFIIEAARKGGGAMAYRILMVDDEPALQQLVGDILSGAG